MSDIILMSAFYALGQVLGALIVCGGSLLVWKYREWVADAWNRKVRKLQAKGRCRVMNEKFDWRKEE